MFSNSYKINIVSYLSMNQSNQLLLYRLENINCKKGYAFSFHQDLTLVNNPVKLKSVK